MLTFNTEQLQMSQEPPPEGQRRTWRQFTIRELLLLTAMAALICGWAADHIYQSKPYPILFQTGFAEARLRNGEILQVERHKDGSVEYKVIWPWRGESPAEGQVIDRDVIKVPASPDEPMAGGAKDQ